MLGTLKNRIGRTRKKFKQEIKDRKEIEEWIEKTEGERAFRAKIKAEYTQKRKTILAAKLKALENKGAENENRD